VQLPDAQQALPRLRDVRGERVARRAVEVERVPEAEVPADLGQNLLGPQRFEPADGGADGGLGARAWAAISSGVPAIGTIDWYW
jgi:hypothetical protein